MTQKSTELNKNAKSGFGSGIQLREILAMQWWYTPLIPTLAGRSRPISNLMPAWSTEGVPGQPGLYTEKPCHKRKRDGQKD